MFIPVFFLQLNHLCVQTLESFRSEETEDDYEFCPREVWYFFRAQQTVPRSLPCFLLYVFLSKNRNNTVVG